MALLSLSSTNPEFSWVVCKAPATQRESGKPFLREARKGTTYGWFTDVKTDSPTAFVMLFRDHPSDISFGRNGVDFEYLDISRFGHPYAAISMIGAQLASASKGTPQDVPAQATVSYFMEGRLSDLQSLARTLSNPQEGYSVVVTPLPGVMGQCDRASEVVCTAPTVKQALNLLESVAVIMALKDDGFYFPMKNQDRERYLRMFGDLKAPYFLYHMFLLLGNIDPGSFTQLQGKGLIPAGLKMGNSQVQRHAAISEKLTGGPLLYDLGCGEGYHALRLAKVYDGVVAVDRDVGLLTRRTAGQADLNVTIKEEELTPTWPTEQGEALAGVHVLLSEVLEHMERADAVTFLRNLLEQKPEKVVVTLPNGEFNKYFPLEEGQTFRHWDHKWEPSFDQVGVFEGEVLPGNWLGMVTIAPGGDTVDGVSLFTIMTFSSDTQEA